MTRMNMNRKVSSRVYAFLLPFMAASLIMWGCSDDSDNGTCPLNGDARAENEIWIENLEFVPDSLAIEAGTTVFWTNKNETEHILVSGIPGNPDGIFVSRTMEQGDIFAFTFNYKGIYEYYCDLHPNEMQGVVTVW